MSRGFPAKITAAQENEMLGMRKQGMTYKEIACYFPVSESRVQQILSRWQTGREQRRVDNYIFPSISKWLNTTGTPLSRIAEYTGYSVTSISNYFRGIHDPPLTFIKGFLKMSGMTFEEAFLEEHEIKSAAPSDAEQKGYNNEYQN